MYIEQVLDLSVQLMKNGGKNKSVAFIILLSVYVCIYIYIYTHTLSHLATEVLSGHTLL